MRVKRVVAGVLIVILCATVVSAQYVPTFGVTAWEGAGAFWAANGKLYTAVKAAITNPQYYNAARWVACELAPATAAIVVRSCVTAGALAGSAVLAGYLAYKGWQLIDGVINAPGPGSWVVVPGTSGVGSTSFPYGSGTVTVKIRNTCEASECAGGYNYWGGTFWNNYFVPNGWSGNWSVYQASGTPPANTYPYVAVRAGAVQWVEGAPTPVPISTVDQALSGDMAAQNQWARDLAVASIAATAVPWTQGKDRGFPPLGLPGLDAGKGTAIGDALASGITDADRTAMASQDVAGNQLLAQLEGLSNPTLTAEQIRTAVRDGVSDAEPLEITMDWGSFNAPSAPAAPPDGEAPEKHPVSEVLDTYWSGLTSLPIAQTLSGIALVSTNSSPVLQITLPAFFGVGGEQISVNFDQDSILGVSYGNYLGLLGNLFVALSALFWTLYIFRRD